MLYKRAAYLMNTQGMPLAKALIAAREDEKLLQKHSTTPCAMAAGAEAAKEAADSLTSSSSRGGPDMSNQQMLQQMANIASKAAKEALRDAGVTATGGGPIDTTKIKLPRPKADPRRRQEEGRQGPRQQDPAHGHEEAEVHPSQQGGLQREGVQVPS